MSSSPWPESLHPISTSLQSSSSPPPAMDLNLRHMTSNTGLSPISAGGKAGSHPAGRLGSKSPSSIPSSPTSVHSSSSAIFERDIEPIIISPSPTHHHHPPNPHRIPRAKATEQLDQSVPSVLDSAAAILAGEDDQVSVLTPATGAAPRSGFTSPMSYRSRSPSPSPGSAHGKRIAGPSSPSSPASTRPIIVTADQTTTPSIVTPTSASFSTAFDEEESPTTTTREHPPPFPPSPTHGPTKRLSFMSYTDLLASTPASQLPLSSLTSSPDPPPHIPPVSGLSHKEPGGTGSAAVSLKGFPLSPPVGSQRDSIILLDDVGGEWEREGLGLGLEERLEALMPQVGKA